MYTIENHVGRLVEIRLESPVSEKEVHELLGLHAKTISTVRGQYVSAIDLRWANVFPQKVTDVLTEIMTRANTRVERSGMLIGESAIFSLQVERVLQEGGGDSPRQAFRTAIELEAWLGEVLSKPEQERMHLFLKGGRK